ncbi:MAG: porphobilinogen synthase [Candidatus Methanolliviera hydrocarbonicum]|uniref:Delta-aminolevulinic acid dehydratase n=1 Tax=Candidatus Methanolliviera hydrocarbonicum TaxID=2491085 RepID=A0A520KV36_9EURY|nr:MAG: porphobilinogen synthase [Candidatus Methanolliviera hydrocarbonicum]
MRRLRRLNLIEETSFKKEDLIYPIFVDENIEGRREIKSMPGQYRFSIKDAGVEALEVRELGIRSVILFGIPSRKDEIGSEAYNKEGVIQRAIREIKREVGDITVIGDVCLCEYTSHGHCGLIKNKRVLNDETLEILGKISKTYAESGADVVAPSGMMDGMVGHIRETLDVSGYEDVAIMSYSAKYNSNFYGPFRDAAESGYKFGDRSTYQMNYKNSDEAMREIRLDIAEGADIVMVKPALPYLDIIYRAKKEFNFPLAAYNVSGEYSMVKYSSSVLDEDKIIEEILLSIKRAGADLIISYHAKDFAKRK